MQINFFAHYNQITKISSHSNTGVRQEISCNIRSYPNVISFGMLIDPLTPVLSEIDTKIDSRNACSNREEDVHAIFFKTKEAITPGVTDI